MENTTQETDRQLEDAKASLMARVEELGRRIQDARHKLDIPAHIAAHPKLAVGAAFAIGALLGFMGGGKRRVEHVHTNAGEDRRGIGGMVTAAIGALIMNAVKNFAMGQVTSAAKEWLDPASVDVTQSNASDATARQPAMKPLFEH